MRRAGPVWECPQIDFKGAVPGDDCCQITSGVLGGGGGAGSVLGISGLWSLSTAADDCLRASVTAQAHRVDGCVRLLSEPQWILPVVRPCE